MISAMPRPCPCPSGQLCQGQVNLQMWKVPEASITNGIIHPHFCKALPGPGASNRMPGLLPSGFLWLFDSKHQYFWENSLDKKCELFLAKQASESSEDISTFRFFVWEGLTLNTKKPLYWKRVLCTWLSLDTITIAPHCDRMRGILSAPLYTWLYEDSEDHIPARSWLCGNEEMVPWLRAFAEQTRRRESRS